MRWLEASDGGPTLLAYLLVAAVCVGAAVTVVLTVRRRDRRAIDRNTTSVAELKSVVRDIRGCFSEVEDPADELARCRAARTRRGVTHARTGRTP